MSMCYYCGEFGANTLDHTIPYSYYSPTSVGKKLKARKGDLVPMVDCCRECNTTLHNKLIIDVRGRANYLKEKYEKKYKRILRLPDWEEKEIKKLGKSLRSTVIKGLIEKESIQERLDYLEYITTLTEDPFIQQKLEGGFIKNIVNPQQLG
tara:strand:+ start:56 stop:508 length:453 start_codon:yes stop_codon:yes gene_type:complete